MQEQSMPSHLEYMMRKQRRQHKKCLAQGQEEPVLLNMPSLFFLSLIYLQVTSFPFLHSAPLAYSEVVFNFPHFFH